jgi:hypothetical protein
VLPLQPPTFASASGAATPSANAPTASAATPTASAAAPAASSATPTASAAAPTASPVSTSVAANPPFTEKGAVASDDNTAVLADGATETDEFEIEMVVDERTNMADDGEDETEYLVKWVGFQKMSDNTWEAAAAVPANIVATWTATKQQSRRLHLGGAGSAPGPRGDESTRWGGRYSTRSLCCFCGGAGQAGRGAAMTERTCLECGVVQHVECTGFRSSGPFQCAACACAGV